jgi:Tol biopolymer transport system component
MIRLAGVFALFGLCNVGVLAFQPNARIESTLVVLDVRSGKEQIVVQESRHFEAPNWSRDGRWLVINSNGRLEKISINGKERVALNTNWADQCNNDHGFSFDGQTLVISHNDPRVAATNNSRIFVLPATGGEPRLVTDKFPSYWHGISPDGKWLVYCAERNSEYDVYRISIEGGAELRLTDAAGLDDGPEYGYDGQWIYFNSHRTGRMHLYRMKPDGGQQEQLTNDACDNWFPHPSPDGKTLAYIAYLQDQKGQHPFGREVKLRSYDLETRTARDLTPVFFGGQGSFNVPSWSPDGTKIAFVKYRMLE